MVSFLFVECIKCLYELLQKAKSISWFVFYDRHSTLKHLQTLYCFDMSFKNHIIYIYSYIQDRCWLFGSYAENVPSVWKQWLFINLTRLTPSLELWSPSGDKKSFYFTLLCQHPSLFYLLVDLNQLKVRTGLRLLCWKPTYPKTQTAKLSDWM